MSVLLRPPAPMPLWPELSLVAGEAVARALRDETGVDATLRHPNDVVVAGRKLVGVLPEATQGRVVLGIGVNVNQPSDELPVDTVKPPTSLRVELGREVERAPLLAAILARARAWLRRLGAPYKDRWAPIHFDRLWTGAPRALSPPWGSSSRRFCSPAAAAAGTSKPRVLAIQFGPDLEVNPVTQDYLTHSSPGRRRTATTRP